MLDSLLATCADLALAPELTHLLGLPDSFTKPSWRAILCDASLSTITSPAYGPTAEAALAAALAAYHDGDFQAFTPAPDRPRLAELFGAPKPFDRRF